MKPTLLWLRTKAGAAGSFFDGSETAEIRSFSEAETAILECLTKGPTKQEICALAGITNTCADDFLVSLQNWGSGALEWQSGEIGTAMDDHRRAIEAMRLRDIWAAMTTHEDENEQFHQVGLDQAEQQFDDIETTISHAFREAHVALNQRSYGEAFCDWLIETGRIGTSCRVIEIGCGLGYFANAILDRLAARRPDIYSSISYTLFDLSPELQSAQRTTCANHSGKLDFILGNIEKHEFGDNRFDLILSNEVIADLSVAAVSMDSIETGSTKTEAETLASHYALECVPIVQGNKRMALLNAGAIKMLENLNHCMGEHGHAVITEYGTSGLSPKAVQFSNHKEFTVHFGHLEKVAKQLGFSASLDTMGNVIGFDDQGETIRMESFRTLCHFVLPYLERAPIPMLAYTPQTLRHALGDTVDAIGNLQFLPLDHPASFSPFRFELLALSQN